mmetsp:Transcript_26789/g.51951  ORF Transcript_26789/g.51951 Transcript_26789/m.51951 type:complete len:355 (+) Transcript_26789:18-1082(+)
MADDPLTGSSGVRASGAKSTADAKQRTTSAWAREKGETTEKQISIFSWWRCVWYVFLVLGGIGIIVFPAAPDTSQLIWDIFFLLIACWGMWHVWNFAYIYALGKSAEDLREYVLKIDAENEEYRNNIVEASHERKRLEEANKKIAESADRFSKALEVLGNTIEGEDGLKAVSDKYEELIGNSRKMILKRAELAQKEIKLDLDQSTAAEKRQAEVVKSYARDLFVESDKDGSRTISKEEAPVLIKRLKDTLGIEIDFDEELKSGDLMRYDMIDKLRKMADAKLERRIKALEEDYEQKLQLLRETYDEKKENPLDDDMVRAMGVDPKTVPTNLAIRRKKEKKEVKESDEKKEFVDL